MKNVFLSIAVVLCITQLSAQTTPAQQLADKIAKKMKDSLSLTDSQKQSIYWVNLQLHNEKLQVRQQFGHTDSVSLKIQAIERTRDTSYYPFLTSSQYLLYKLKKRNLVNGN